jgi:FMN phosphatase YigB (HAD superfamily)
VPYSKAAWSGAATAANSDWTSTWTYCVPNWGLDIPVDDFISARRASTRIRPDMLAVCETLAENVSLAIFTNNGYWLQQHADRIVPELMPLFGTRFVSSGVLGVAKPDPDAFVRCAATARLQRRLGPVRR